MVRFQKFGPVVTRSAPRDSRTPLAAAALCTRARLREFLLLKSSVECFHTMRWTVACDRYCHDFFMAQGWPRFSAIEFDLEEASEPQTLPAELMALKMRALRTSIERHGPSFLFDCDLLFVAPLPADALSDLETGTDVLVIRLFAAVDDGSEHQAADQILREFGPYNSGLVGFSEPALVDVWEQQTLRATGHVGSDQVGLWATLKDHSGPTRELSAGCNFGWWRWVDQPTILGTFTTSGASVYCGAEEVISFHFHADPTVRRPVEALFGRFCAKLLARSSHALHRNIAARLAEVIEGDPQPPEPRFPLPGGSRIRFREWGPSDTRLAAGLWGDPRVTRLIDSRTPLTPAQVEEILARQMEWRRCHGVQYWPFFSRQTGEHLGCCGLRPRAATDGYELGFQVRANHWGQGFATEAAVAVIDHAFERLGLAEVFAGHHPDNEASRRVLTRLGFEYVHHELYLPTGLMHPSYRLRAAAYQARERPASR